jgi:hypothetical protein
MSTLTHMAGSLPLVLAKGELAGLIFFVIWVIVALVSSAQKKKQQKRPSQLPAPQDWNAPQGQAMRPQGPAALRRSAPTLPVRGRIDPAKPSPLPPKKTPVAKATPPKLPAPAALPVQEPVWQPVKDMVQSQWAKSTTRSSQMQVMLRPATVRQGIVLAEILRPPLALREEECAW